VNEPTPEDVKRTAPAESPERESVESIIGFRVGTTWLGVETDAVQEITDYTEPTPLPRCPPHIPGLMNLRGQAVPLLDLSVFLDLEDQTGNANRRDGSEKALRRVLVVFAADMRVGLLCDRILGVLEMPRGDIGEIKLAQNRRLIEFARGELDASARILVVLTIDKLLSAAQATG